MTECSLLPLTHEYRENKKRPQWNHPEIVCRTVGYCVRFVQLLLPRPAGPAMVFKLIDDVGERRRCVDGLHVVALV